MSFKLLDRYIFKQVLTITIFGIFLFTVIWISPEILFKIIRKFIFGEIDFYLAVKLFFLEIPEILSKTIPIALLAATLYVFDRLSKDSELTIIRIAGVNTLRLLLPVVILGILGTITCFSIYKDVMPHTTNEIKRLKGDIFQKHFVYIDKKQNEKPKQILIVGGYNGTYIYDIKLLRFSEGVNADTSLMESIITAENAVVKDNHWQLNNVVRYDIGPNGVYRDIKHLKETDILSEKSAKEAEQLLIYSTKRPREMNNRALEKYISLLASLEMPEEHRFVLSKYYQKFSRSFGCILFCICGVLLGISKPREKRFIGFTAGAVLVFMYYILVPFLDMLAQRGSLTPGLAAWFPDIMVLAVILVLIRFRNV